MALSPSAKTSFIVAVEAGLGESLPSSFGRRRSFCTKLHSQAIVDDHGAGFGVFFYHSFLRIKLIQRPLSRKKNSADSSGNP